MSGIYGLRCATVVKKTRALRTPARRRFARAHLTRASDSHAPRHLDTCWALFRVLLPGFVICGTIFLSEPVRAYTPEPKAAPDKTTPYNKEDAATAKPVLPRPSITPKDLMDDDDIGFDDVEEFIKADPSTFEEPSEPEQVPEVHYDLETLPVPVRRMRAQILEAAATGDLMRLKPIFTANGAPPSLSASDVEDPISFLKQSSGDDEGIEILGILTDILDTGYVRLNAGTPQELYVWPYFASYPLDQLTARQKVEMYRILTAADFIESRDFGAYIFYRTGIGVDGTWLYFLSGD